jgi:hypothetical protein
MDVFRPKRTLDFPNLNVSEEGSQSGIAAGAAPLPDPRLQPTPDYGSLGPDSDFARSQAKSLSAPSVSGVSNEGRRAPANVRASHLLAIVGGIVAALAASSNGGARPMWGKIIALFAPQKSSVASSSPLSKRDLDRQRPQQQAEILLTRAVSHSSGATDEIQSRIEGWRGKLELNPQLSQLTTVALNSTDQNVRASAIEVQLAAYDLNKSDSTVDTLVRRADSSIQAQKIWALWTLGLLGNRGIETDRVVQVLTSHLASDRDSDEHVRDWAVEGLALVGTSSTIAPLLKALHDDPSALVRERAACSLAESGMLTHEQRLTAVPELINDSDDPALDTQTHAWAFQALADITKQRLPNDSAAWRNWYQTSVSSRQ